jgi:cytochrome bd-type quinol oxidase subunit 1
MNIFQRIAGAFAAIVFLVAAICGWIAWRGRLNEKKPIVRSAKILSVIFILFSVAVCVLFYLAFKDLTFR